MSGLDKKKEVLEKLNAEYQELAQSIINTPGYKEAMIDREEHVAKGELWITEEAIKFAPLFMKLAIVEDAISRAAATRAEDFNKQ